MAKEKILENNKLIAEFMKITTNHPVWQYRAHENEWKLEGLKYHKSWTWLMPVLEKICRLKIGDGIVHVEYATPYTFGVLNRETGQIMVRLNAHQLFEADTLIEATYLAVIDFIKLNNEENKGSSTD